MKSPNRFEQEEDKIKRNWHFENKKVMSDISLEIRKPRWHEWLVLFAIVVLIVTLLLVK
ncbi:MAG: hypothetical protein LBM95_00085 [Lactobacillales bacterium]|jgi:hypothetical protein|nr:hypothetical protein [Lactobacillales bacterium]